MALSNNMKWFHSIKSGLIFLLLITPFMFNLTQKLFGGFITIADYNGHPTTAGMVLHAIVFVVILRFLMG